MKLLFHQHFLLCSKNNRTLYIRGCTSQRPINKNTQIIRSFLLTKTTIDEPFRTFYAESGNWLNLSLHAQLKKKKKPIFYQLPATTTSFHIPPQIIPDLITNINIFSWTTQQDAKKTKKEEKQYKQSYYSKQI